VIVLVRRQTLRWIQCALAAFSALALGYCGFAIAGSWMFQNRAGRQLELMSLPSAPVVPVSAYAGLIGRIEIPRLGVSVVVIEGSTEAILRRAAGHIAGTGLPGQPGNIGISAHRDTFFRPLRNIRKNDVITFTTPGGRFRYRVVATSIVPPADVSVLNPGRSEILTLVTCYPFYFIGSAPDRFIVRAERII
jgi:sortase A